MSEEFSEVVLREKERSLHISRVPKRIKDEFTQYAEDEFTGDFGMCLKEIWDKYKEMQIYYSNFDIKLNHIIQILDKPNSDLEKTEEKPKSMRKMLDGRIVEKEVK